MTDIASAAFAVPPPNSVSVAPSIINVPPPGLGHITEPPPQLNPMLTRMPPPGMYIRVYIHNYTSNPHASSLLEHNYFFF